MPFPKCAGQSSVFEIYRFQNLPAKNVPFSPIRHSFHRFQNVPASCERGLDQTLKIFLRHPVQEYCL